MVFCTKRVQQRMSFARERKRDMIDIAFMAEEPVLVRMKPTSCDGDDGKRTKEWSTSTRASVSSSRFTTLSTLSPSYQSSPSPSAHHFTIIELSIPGVSLGTFLESLQPVPKTLTPPPVAQLFFLELHVIFRDSPWSESCNAAQETCKSCIGICYFT